MMEDLLNSTRGLFNLCRTNADLESFLKLNNENIKIVRDQLKYDENLSVGEKSKLENILAIFQSYNVQVVGKQRNDTAAGTGLASSSSPSSSSQHHHAGTDASSTNNSSSLYSRDEQNVVWKKVCFIFIFTQFFSTMLLNFLPNFF